MTQESILDHENEDLTPRWLREIKESYKIIDIEKGGGKYTITTEEFGVVDFFPKANKVLVRKDNDWIEPGLSWVVKNLLSHES